MTPTILLTAFEPFAGADVNPSARVAEALAGATIPGARLVTATLPVVVAGLPGVFGSLVEQHRPDAVLSLGEARGALRIRIELRAMNRLVFQTDNSGAPAADVPVVPTGPAEYASSFPAEAIFSAMTSRGVPCELSLSAGTYCCNQILYHAVHHAALYRPAMLAGFLHLPSLPEQRVAGQPVASAMPLTQQVTAVRTALDELARELARRNGAPGPTA